MRGTLQGIAVTIVGVTGCLGYVLGFLLWLAGLVFLIGIWGGLIWALLWLMFGFGLVFLVVDLLRLPFLLLAMGLMWLAGGDPDELRQQAQ